MNIVWRKPDGGLAVTVIGEETLQLMECIRRGESADSLLADMGLTCSASEWADYNGLSALEHAEKLKARELIYKDWEIVAIDAEVPGDRTFRNAWVFNQAIHIDMPKARDIHMSRIREKRNAELERLDKEQLKYRKDAARVNLIEDQKQVLRDIPQTFDLLKANTPEELKALWPEIL